MPELFPYILLLHILGAIVAFGPTFAFPLIGAMGGREPMHANFATRLSLGIEERMVLPLAVVQGITGLLLVWSASIDLTAAHWLDVAIVLYLIALFFSIFVQTASVKRVIELTTMPAGGPPPGAPAGPPPGVAAAVQRVQRGGALLSVLVVAIVCLMVVRPTF